MSYCPKCGCAAGGSDRTGRVLPNHICGVDLFNEPASYAELNADELAAAKRLKEMSREITERYRLERIVDDAKAAADADAESRRQEQMRADQRAFNRRKELERLQRDAALDTFCDRYGFEQGEQA